VDKQINKTKGRSIHHCNNLKQKNMNKLKTKNKHLSIAEIDEALLGFAALIIFFGSFMAFLFYYLGR
jgi:hypothetical protein